MIAWRGNGLVALMVVVVFNTIVNAIAEKALGLAPRRMGHSQRLPLAVASGYVAFCHLLLVLRQTLERTGRARHGARDPLHNSGGTVVRGSGWAARRLFAANSPAIGKKSNAADRPSPRYHRPQGVMQRVPRGRPSHQPTRARGLCARTLLAARAMVERALHGDRCLVLAGVAARRIAMPLLVLP